jgi:hypothetical protein
MTDAGTDGVPSGYTLTLRGDGRGGRPEPVFDHPGAAASVRWSDGGPAAGGPGGRRSAVRAAGRAGLVGERDTSEQAHRLAYLFLGQWSWPAPPAVTDREGGSTRLVGVGGRGARVGVCEDAVPMFRQPPGPSAAAGRSPGRSA